MCWPLREHRAQSHVLDDIKGPEDGASITASVVGDSAETLFGE